MTFTEYGTGTKYNNQINDRCIGTCVTHGVETGKKRSLVRINCKTEKKPKGFRAFLKVVKSCS